MIRSIGSQFILALPREGNLTALRALP
jgi:hypothetical protein